MYLGGKTRFVNFSQGIIFKSLFLSLLMLGSISCKKNEYERGDNVQSANETGSQTFNAIYLHWTAGGYECPSEAAYHTMIKGSGEVLRSNYDIGRNEHTFGRNTDSVAISLCCMWHDWKTPCKQQQFTAMAKEVAMIAKKYNWSIDDITAKPKDSINGRRVMTHAEAAASWDFPKDNVIQAGSNGDEPAKKRFGLKHDNYGPRQWDPAFDWPGSTRGELRWDLAQLHENDKMGSGGDELRKMIRKEMGGAQSGTVEQGNTAPVIVKPDIVKPDIVKLDICDEIANEK